MLQIPYDTWVALRSDRGRREAKAAAKAEERRKAKLRRLDYDVRERLIENVCRILKTGKPTKFEFEGACRSGIRRHLVLNGWRWADADNAATEVVSKALDIIGAERPSYAEGQREWALNFDVDRTRCAYYKCNRPIPEERRNSSQSVKYCSDACNKYAAQHRKAISGERRSMAEWLAECAQKSAKSVEDRTRPCENERCGRPFIADRYYSKYCSYECANDAARRLPETPCASPACGEMFFPRMVKVRGKDELQPQKYCSTKCMAVGRWGQRENVRACANPECRAHFSVKYPSDAKAFCSRYCISQARKLKKQSAFVCEPVSTTTTTEDDFLKHLGVR